MTGRLFSKVLILESSCCFGFALYVFLDSSFFEGFLFVVVVCECVLIGLVGGCFCVCDLFFIVCFGVGIVFKGWVVYFRRWGFAGIVGFWFGDGFWGVFGGWSLRCARVVKCFGVSVVWIVYV